MGRNGPRPEKERLTSPSSSTSGHQSTSGCARCMLIADGTARNSIADRRRRQGIMRRKVQHA
eukprot:5679850-Prymnesium_polylepis.1